MAIAIHSPTVPTLAAAIAFRCKVTALQFKRAIRNIRTADLKRYRPSVDLISADVQTIAQSQTPLWSANTADNERALTLGKIHNLRVALRRLNGIVVPAHCTFSFWAQIGPPTQRAGFVSGRELREGCIIPTIGGGLCQLSNALYDAALKAGFDIIERHAHSQVVPGSLAESGRDATVFWNHVDLRFRAPHTFRIETELTRSHLLLRFKTWRSPSVEIQTSPVARSAITRVNDCTTCGVSNCFRHRDALEASTRTGRTAFLVGDPWPEFKLYCKQTRGPEDFYSAPPRRSASRVAIESLP